MIQLCLLCKVYLLLTWWVVDADCLYDGRYEKGYGSDEVDLQIVDLGMCLTGRQDIIFVRYDHSSTHVCAQQVGKIITLRS
jgi:hypothetical protein